MPPRKTKASVVQEAVKEIEKKIEAEKVKEPEVTVPAATSTSKSKRAPNKWAAFCSQEYSKNYKPKGISYKTMLASAELKKDWEKQKS